MKYTQLNAMEQAAVALRDCGLIYVTGDRPARFDGLVKFGLAECAPHRLGGIVYRLTEHGRRSLVASGIGA